MSSTSTTTTEIPILRRSAQVARRGGRLVIEHLDEEVSLEGAGAALFERMLPHLDGKSTIEQIARRLEEHPARVGALVEGLRRALVLGFAGDGASGRTMTGAEFYEIHRRYARSWLRPVYEHPLWEKIATGAASRAQVIGFAFEKYHYIEGAYEHMAVAAANATREMMPHLARHFIEEFNHGDIYRKGLGSLFPHELVLHAQPLPSTRALVNFLSETAARSSFAYYAGNEVLQMTENTSDLAVSRSIDSFYEAMKRHYPWSDRLVASFVAHTHADQKLGHEGVFEQMCASVPPLGAAEVTDALDVARAMTEHLLLFMDGIDAFYGRFPAVPRTPCTLLSE
jgi:pyrroloquinoline quinone (PQQ) biosynthesis protein C